MDGVNITPRIYLNEGAVSVSPFGVWPFNGSPNDKVGTAAAAHFAWLAGEDQEYYTAGVEGLALQLKVGQAYFIPFAQVTALDLGAGDDLVVSFKIRVDQTPSTGTRRIIDKTLASPERRWACVLNSSGQLVWRVCDGSSCVTITTTTTLTEGVWYSVSLVVDRYTDELRVFIQGQEDASSPADASGLGAIPSAGAAVIMGASADFAFSIDQLEIDAGAGAAWTEEQYLAFHGAEVGDEAVSVGLLGWVDISEDVVTRVTADWGVHSSNPKDRLADVGRMRFDLDNNTTSSGGVRGYYSPDGASRRGGFALNAGVRLTMATPLLGEKTVWEGKLEGIRPRPGLQRPVTSVSCSDWLEDASRARLAGLAVQTDIQSDALFNVLVGAVDAQPPNGTIVGSGSDIYPYALDNVQDEDAYVYDELDKLARSEYGYIYVQAGVLTFEGRRRRGGVVTPSLVLEEDTNIIGMTVSRERDEIINRVQVTIHPRRRDAAATTVLFTLGSSVEIPRNTEVIINCPYSDPNQQAQRVGGVDMVTPVQGTDYFFNTLEDGTGTDIAFQLAIVATFGGNTAQLAITNNGPSDGFIPAGGLQLRGRGIYDFEPILADRRDQGSIDTYGENVVGYDMPHQSRPQNAVDLAQYLLDLYSDPTTRCETVTFLANWDDATVAALFGMEISEQVTVTSSSMGFDAVAYFVNGWKLDVEMSGVVQVTLDLGPVDLAQYWILEVTGRTELDETTILGYGLFVAGWKLGTSQLGVNTFLN